MAMTVGEAAAVLRRMYENAPRGKKLTCIFLFGIIYADDLAALSVRDVVRESGVRPTYYTEILRGINLAKYVQIKPEFAAAFASAGQ